MNKARTLLFMLLVASGLLPGCGSSPGSQSTPTEPPSPPAPQIVQSAGCSNAASVSSPSCTSITSGYVLDVPEPVTAGDTMVVFFGAYYPEVNICTAGGVPPLTATDNFGNSYKQLSAGGISNDPVTGLNGPVGCYIASIFYAQTAAGGSDMAITLSPGESYFQDFVMVAAELNGTRYPDIGAGLAGTETEYFCPEPGDDTTCIAEPVSPRDTSHADEIIFGFGGMTFPNSNTQVISALGTPALFGSGFPAPPSPNYGPSAIWFGLVDQTSTFIGSPSPGFTAPTPVYYGFVDELSFY